MNVNTAEWEAASDLIMRMLPILLPLILLNMTLMIVSIISIVKKPNPMSEKVIWLLIVVFINLIGSVLYFVLGSGMLDEKWARQQDLRDQMRGDYPHNNGGMS